MHRLEPGGQKPPGQPREVAARLHGTTEQELEGEQSMNIRNATPNDAPTILDMVDLAGEGIPRYLWRTGARNGESPLEAGLRQMSERQGEFSFTHSRVYAHQDAVVGVCQAFDLDSVRDRRDIQNCCDVIRGLVELEQMAQGSWYINALATASSLRGRGVGRALLADSVRRADALGLRQVSLIVSSNNRPAKALYDRLGFRFEAQRVAEQFPEQGHGGEWILMLAETDALIEALPMQAAALPASETPRHDRPHPAVAQSERRHAMDSGVLAVGT
ncbi:MAG: GNAT family N-acetyltransferase [Nevskiales bacterium]|nr:GNAT family N-acetyltransferase [Nevskiales bacterium]